MSDLQFIEAFRAVQKAAFNININKGFYDGSAGQNLGEKIALVHSELSELLEAARKAGTHASSDKNIDMGNGRLMTNIEEELADVVIRCMDIAEWQNGAGLADLGQAIIKKMAYNALRPLKNGKLF